MPSWPNGYGQSLGDRLVTSRPVMTSYITYFVSSTSGSDSNDGLDPDTAFATLAHAISVAAGNTTVIVLMSGHTETLTATLTPTAGTIIVGAGSSGGKPTVKLKMNAAATIMFTCSNSGVQIRNIWFQSNQQTNSSSRVKFTGINGRVIGCYFECAATDTGASLEFGTGGSGGTVKDTTFISTATVTSALPAAGLTVTAALTDISIDNVTFNEGSVGFNGVALSCSATVTRLRAEDLAFVNGSSALFGASTGIVTPTTTTGGASISYSGGA